MFAMLVQFLLSFTLYEGNYAYGYDRQRQNRLVREYGNVEHYSNDYFVDEYDRDYGINEIDYDKLIKQQEENDILRYMSAQQEYDDDNMDEMDEFELPVDRAALVLHGNHGRATGVMLPNAKSIFVRVPGVPDRIQVRWPDSTTAHGALADAYTGQVDFLWDTWKELWDANVFDATSRYHVVEEQIYFFRKSALNLLLLSSNGGGGGGAADNRQCFDDMGSKKPKSDLDFSLVRWDSPTNIVLWLGNFYQECKAVFNKLPIKAFDMTWYVATGYISVKPNLVGNPDRNRNRNCYALVSAGVRNELLTQIDASNNANYQLWGIGEKYTNTDTHQAAYVKFDEYLQFYLINQRTNQRNPGYPPNALKYLLKLSKIYYNEIDRVGRDLNTVVSGGPGGHVSNDNRLYIHALLLWMNYYSDESYISNIALYKIWFMQKSEIHDPARVVWNDDNPQPLWRTPPSNSQRYLLVLDQLAFVREYLVKSTKKRGLSAYSYFVDKISKYGQRAGEILDSSIGAIPNGGGGIANFFGQLAKDSIETNDGIVHTGRNHFKALYDQLTKYEDQVRGKTGATLKNIRIWYRRYPKEDVGHATWGAEAGWPAKKKGAKILREINRISHLTEATPTSIWNNLIRPLQKDLTNYFKNSLSQKNKDVLEAAMKHIIRSGMGTPSVISNIILTNVVFVNDTASTIANTLESSIDANWFAAASARGGSTKKWDTTWPT